MTADHVPGTRDPEGDLLCDADLAVLAGTPEEYAAYVADVREEYAAVPDDQFLEARFDVLSRWWRARSSGPARASSSRPRPGRTSRTEVLELAERLGVEPPRPAALSRRPGRPVAGRAQWQAGRRDGLTTTSTP